MGLNHSEHFSLQLENCENYLRDWCVRSFLCSFFDLTALTWSQLITRIKQKSNKKSCANINLIMHLIISLIILILIEPSSCIICFDEMSWSCRKTVQISSLLRFVTIFWLTCLVSIDGLRFKFFFQQNCFCLWIKFATGFHQRPPVDFQSPSTRD